MVIGERLDAEGRPLRTALERVGDAIRIVDDSGIDAMLPARAVVGVMRRYGRPLERSPVGFGDERLELGDGVALRSMRHRAQVDVIARDYLVLLVAGEPPIALLANEVARVLRALAANR